MPDVHSPLKRVFITGALISAMALPTIAMVSAQEATPEATPEVAAEAVQTDAGFLGVQIADQDGVVVVVSVLADSPAEAAGLQAGDVITEVNGEAVTTPAEVSAAISALMAGDTVALTIDRAGETVEAEAVLAAQSDFEVASSDATDSEIGRGGRFGMRLMDHFGLSYNSETGRYTVDEVAEDSELYADGLRAGDEITAIDGEAYDPAALLAYIGTVGTDADLVLQVVREGETVEVTVPAIHIFVVGASAGMDDLFSFEQMLPDGQGFGGMMGQSLNGYLGVSFLTLDETVAAEQGVTLTDGALVVEVAADSPAATAGLEAGDVITAVNGEVVDAEHTLRDRLRAYEPDDVLTFTVVRGDAEQQIEATLGQPADAIGSMLPGMNGGSSRGGNSGGNSRGGSGRGGNSGRGGSNAPNTQVTPEVTPEATVEPGASA